jgi:hypothetical protein
MHSARYSYKPNQRHLTSNRYIDICCITSWYTPCYPNGSAVLRRESVAARLVGLWVRILLGA